jgi:CRISPR/Cas system-associated endonuclease Cas1
LRATPRFGRPALALDLMEGFRPLVAEVQRCR